MLSIFRKFPNTPLSSSLSCIHTGPERTLWEIFFGWEQYQRKWPICVRACAHLHKVPIFSSIPQDIVLCRVGLVAGTLSVTTHASIIWPNDDDNAYRQHHERWPDLLLLIKIYLLCMNIFVYTFGAWSSRSRPHHTHLDWIIEKAAMPVWQLAFIWSFNGTFFRTRFGRALGGTVLENEVGMITRRHRCTRHTNVEILEKMTGGDESEVRRGDWLIASLIYILFSNIYLSSTCSGWKMRRKHETAMIV